jgi:hypothetical protein
MSHSHTRIQIQNIMFHCIKALSLMPTEHHDAPKRPVVRHPEASRIPNTITSTHPNHLDIL